MEEMEMVAVETEEMAAVEMAEMAVVEMEVMAVAETEEMEEGAIVEGMAAGRTAPCCKAAAPLALGKALHHSLKSW